MLSSAGAIKELIRRKAQEAGFALVGFTAPDHLTVETQNMKTWLEEGRHGNMDWLTGRIEERTRPQTYFPPVATIVSLGMNYHTVPPRRPTGALPKWSSY
ncbi:hypothetical protein ACFLZR_01565, partial [Candidatus Neomarinimicrobiota bacterium]